MAIYRIELPISPSEDEGDEELGPVVRCIKSATALAVPFGCRAELVTGSEDNAGNYGFAFIGAREDLWRLVKAYLRQANDLASFDQVWNTVRPTSPSQS
jgi:hypothetical protein